MDEMTAALDGLKQNVSKLLEQQKQLQKEVKVLRTKYETASVTTDEQKREIAALKESRRVDAMARSAADEAHERADAKKRINELVREIDKCIALLNE